MKRLLAWLAGSLLVLVLALGGLLVLAIDGQPLVSRNETISPLSIAQARWLLQSNDPRRLRPGEARRAAIPAALIDDAINYAATRFFGGRGSLALIGSEAEIRLTRRLPGIPVERFINVTTRVTAIDGKPSIISARLGSLPVPVPLAERLLIEAIQRSSLEREARLAAGAIRELQVDSARNRLIVSYVWEPALLDQARAIAVPPEEVARLRAAHERLVTLLAAHPPGSRLALSELLRPLLAAQPGDPTDGRRAAIFVLAAYLSEKNLARVLPEAAHWPRMPPVAPTLLGRIDSAQHFVISAALAAWAGEPLADAIGLYKELADARHGSGFSFADLAADRAGTTFGELLLKRPERLDQLLRQPIEDTQLVPALAGLPESLSEAEFRRRFGHAGSPAYQQLAAEIEQRIAALPLYGKSSP